MMETALSDLRYAARGLSKNPGFTATALLTEYYQTPYRSVIPRAKRDEDDLFMLFVFSEMMGVPNPATYYTLELQPLLLEQFHEWHMRMGMEHSPLDGFRCC